MSPAYLRANPSSRAGSVASRRLYWIVLLLFWAVLIAIPLADNLGVAWILLEATTAASALLVAFSGKRSAIEAGWKYLVLTSLGLAFALFGIVILSVQLSASGGGATDLGWGQIAARAPALQSAAVVTAFVLMVAGLATKGGWAPVHNWLPDAHSEAPPPVSALLSAALLPTVALVAWRLARRPRAGGGRGHRPDPLHRVRHRLARRGGALPVAAPAVEAAARLLQPRAHGRHRPRHRDRPPDRDRRRAAARRRPRRGEVARLLGGRAAPALPAGRGAPSAARPRAPRPGAGRRRGGEPGRARGAAAVAPLHQRDPRARRRRRGRPDVGRGGRRRTPRAGLPGHGPHAGRGPRAAAEPDATRAARAERGRSSR